MNIWIFSKLMLMKPLFFVLALAVLLSPFSANAGIFSFVESIFDKSVAEIIPEKPVNSQNMVLLHAALHTDPNPAKGGGDITVIGGSALLPDAGPSGTLADIEEGVNPHGQISLYVVREGDSLSQIAKMFGVTTSTIIWANDIDRGSLIQKGQTLVILPVSGVQHTVVKGETLQSIAKKYKGDIDEILDYNGLTLNSALAIGDVVVIPDGEIATPSYSGSTQTVVRGTSVPSYSGYYLRPLDGGVKTQGLHGYNGVDLAAPAGTPIYASAAGDVIISRGSGWNGGYGTYIVIQHGNNTQTLYSHNSKNIVSAGQRVVKGQIIGYVGSTGKSTGAHLHIEIRGAKNPF